MASTARSAAVQPRPVTDFREPLYSSPPRRPDCRWGRCRYRGIRSPETGGRRAMRKCHLCGSVIRRRAEFCRFCTARQPGAQIGASRRRCARAPTGGPPSMMPAPPETAFATTTAPDAPSPASFEPVWDARPRYPTSRAGRLVRGRDRWPRRSDARPSPIRGSSTSPCAPPMCRSRGRNIRCTTRRRSEPDPIPSEVEPPRSSSRSPCVRRRIQFRTGAGRRSGGEGRNRSKPPAPTNGHDTVRTNGNGNGAQGNGPRTGSNGSNGSHRSSPLDLLRRPNGSNGSNGNGHNGANGSSHENGASSPPAVATVSRPEPTSAASVARRRGSRRASSISPTPLLQPEVRWG